MNERVQLQDGSIVDATHDEWPEICSPKAMIRNAGGKLVKSLTVRKHLDGRVLVYGATGIQRPGSALIAREGMIVAPGGNPKDAIVAVARLLELPEWLVDQCLSMLPRATTDLLNSSRHSCVADLA